MAQLLQQPSTKGSEAVLVSRRAIYTHQACLFAYELVYQHDIAEEALSGAFLNTFLDIGLETLVGENRAFMNVNRASLLRDYCRALPHERVVLGIPREIEPEESVVRALVEMKDSGYALALDDFDFNDRKTALLDLASYVSVDFRRFSREEISAKLPLLGGFKGKLLAKGLETHEEFEFASNSGFEFFSGACFNRPKAAKATRVPINRVSTLQLVLKLQDPDLTTAELERAVSQDVALSLKLLQYVNSADLALARNIESIKHAIQMVGTERIRLWASLLLLTKLDDKPAELITTALVRATMAERLALAMDVPNPESYFMIGLFSVADAVLNLPMTEAVGLLPLSKPIREALVGGSGSMGSVLRCVLAYETGTWGEVSCGDLSLTTIRQSYVDALSAIREMPKISHS